MGNELVLPNHLNTLTPVGGISLYVVPKGYDSIIAEPPRQVLLHRSDGTRHNFVVVGTRPVKVERVLSYGIPPVLRRIFSYSPTNLFIAERRYLYNETEAIITDKAIALGFDITARSTTASALDRIRDKIKEGLQETHRNRLLEQLPYFNKEHKAAILNFYMTNMSLADSIKNANYNRDDLTGRLYIVRLIIESHETVVMELKGTELAEIADIKVKYLKMRLSRAILQSKMSEEQKSAMHLFYLAGKSMREIQKTQHVTENTLKSTLSRGRQFINEQVEELFS